MIRARETPPAGAGVPDEVPRSWLHDEIPLLGQSPATRQMPPPPPPPVPVAQPAGRSDNARLWAAGLAAGLVLIVVAGVGGYFGLGYLKARPIKQDFEAAQTTLAPLLEAIAGAESLDQAVDAVDPDIAGQLEGLRGTAEAADSEFAVASLAVLDAELALHHALGGLQDLTGEDFSSWPQTRGAIEEAAADIEGATKKMAALDADAAALVPPTADALGQVGLAVAGRISTVAAEALGGSLAALEGARTTAQIRAVAAEAAAQQAAIDAAQGDAPDEGLSAYAAAFGSLAALSVLDAEHLDSWSALRADLSSTTTQVPDSAAGAAIAAVDTVVEKGTVKLKEWEETNSAAIAQQAADLADLTTYGDEMNKLALRYDKLRADLGDWFDAVQDESAYVTYSDAYSTLWDAQYQRTEIRDAMNELAVPGALQSQHAGVVGVLDDGIAAMGHAYDAMSDADSCYDTCYYRDTSSWLTFHEESERITDAYADALTAWRDQLGAARTAVETRLLPRKPKI